MSIGKRYIHDGHRVVFAGHVKRRNRPDPLLDKVTANRGGDIEEDVQVDTEGLVTLRVHSDPSDPRGDMPIELNLNGKNYILARDQSATVPREIAEVLQRSACSTSYVPNPSKTKTSQEGSYISPLEEETNTRFNLEIEQEA